MGERMTQVLGNLRSAVGSDKWDAFFEAMYDAFGKHDELDGENAVLFEQVQNLKRENNRLHCELDRVQGERGGWIELPKDADGEYIQPSDIPYLTKANDGKRLAYCPSLELRQDGTWRLAGWTPDRYRILKPTVEDVLREFGDWYAHTKGGCDEDGIIAEYAAKLRLAEGGLMFGVRKAYREIGELVCGMQQENADLKAENAKLRELFYKVYGYYVSGTLTPCDFCDICCCEGNAPTVCKADEYNPDGMVVEEIERRMRDLGVDAG